MSGFRFGATHFDDLFDPDIVGDGPAAEGLKVGAAAVRYAKLSYGSKRANVGIIVPGVGDVSNLWAAKGTAVYSIPGLNGKQLSAVDQALTNQSTVSASTTVTINHLGQWSVGAATSRGAGVSVPEPTSGVWLPSGTTVSDHEVQFVVTHSGEGTLANNATSYVSCTSSRTVSLTLPSLAANNGRERIGSATISIRLRRISTGQVTTTGVGMSVRTVGFL